MTQEQFQPGATICLRADRSREGVVTEVLTPISGEQRYRVFHGPGDTQEYFGSQILIASTSPRSDGLGILLAGDAVDATDFAARLTAARLSHPQIDNLYALHAARIKHIPFQFKPLMRLLRADQPRLLIADEVGVGKTIEAGLILTELRARHRLDNVLVVCPKALVTKWRAEMRRFDEDFRILGSQELRYCLDEAHLDGTWPGQYGRIIVPLELFRMDEYLRGSNGRQVRRGLTELDPAPRFNLLIVDEAHHVRNPEANSHGLIRYLCEQSEAAIFLSATPVHLGSRNLYSLLNLLRPDLFPDETVFSAMIEPNRHLTRAMRLVRRRATESWQTESAAALTAAGNTPWGSRSLSNDPRFSEWMTRLQQTRLLSDEERIRCLRDIEEVHTLAHVMNRTRRRDIGRFTIREPHTVSVHFTAEQQEFYDALLDFRREVLLLRHDPQVVRLITDTLERQAASCLPGILPALRGFVRTGRFSAQEHTDDIEDNEGGTIDLPRELIERAHALEILASNLPADDPKRDRLLSIVKETQTSDGPGKVLVFSFFLHTLAYLEQALNAMGARTGVVSGQVPEEERERLRDRFRLSRNHPDAIDVLLSSEVGCEGLDYEFCDRMVNYDIPWNPMRIEQRIGRIDRFGQTAEKVLIFNFITPGTVEERIFFRCYERLGVFRDTVGDMEEVLGELVQNLTRVAFDASLSPDQAEEVAAQEIDNALRLAQEQQRLERESEGLLGLDHALEEEVDAVRVEGRFVAAEDLRVMVESYLGRPGIEGRLIPDERSGLYRLRLRREARLSLLEEVQSGVRADRVDRSIAELTRWLRGDEPVLTITFDQEAAVAYRSVPFVTPVHPLAKAAVNYWSQREGPLTTRLTTASDDAPQGLYVFVCDLWETVASKPELRLVSAAWDVDAAEISQPVSGMLLRLLSGAKTLDVSPLDLPISLEGVLAALDEHAYQLRADALGELRARNDSVIDRRLASLDTYYRNRLNRAEADLAASGEERIVRMRQSELRRIKHDHGRLRAELEAQRVADITTRRVASGLLEVRNGL